MDISDRQLWPVASDNGQRKPEAGQASCENFASVTIPLMVLEDLMYLLKHSSINSRNKLERSEVFLQLRHA